MYNSKPFKSIETYFVAHMWSILVNVLRVLRKYFAALNDMFLNIT